MDGFPRALSPEAEAPTLRVVCVCKGCVVRDELGSSCSGEESSAPVNRGLGCAWMWESTPLS